MFDGSFLVTESFLKNFFVFSILSKMDISRDGWVPLPVVARSPDSLIDSEVDFFRNSDIRDGRS